MFSVVSLALISIFPPLPVPEVLADIFPSPVMLSFSGSLILMSPPSPLPSVRADISAPLVTAREPV